MTSLVERLRTTSTERTWDSVGRPYDYPKHLPLEAADRIEELEQAGRLVEEWWLEQGANHFNGAPYAIFALRSALSDSSPTLLQEQKDNGGKEGE